MALTYDSIATTTVSGSAVTTISFNTIPATFTDLRIVMRGDSGSSNNHFIRFNSDSTASYSASVMATNGGSNQSFMQTSQTSMYLDFYQFEVSGFTIIDIFNYNNTTLFKSVLSQNPGNGYYPMLVGGVWAKTDAITSITLLNYSSNTFPVGYVAALYGIKAA